MADDKSQPKTDQRRPEQVQTAEDLRQKIAEVRGRVEEATKPAGPLSLLFGVTTST